MCWTAEITGYELLGGSGVSRITERMKSATAPAAIIKYIVTVGAAATVGASNNNGNIDGVDIQKRYVVLLNSLTPGRFG